MNCPFCQRARAGHRASQPLAALQALGTAMEAAPEPVHPANVVPPEAETASCPLPGRLHASGVAEWQYQQARSARPAAAGRTSPVTLDPSRSVYAARRVYR